MKIDTQLKDRISNSSNDELIPNHFLVDLLTSIKLQGYKFITTTPRTHEHFLSKVKRSGQNLQDIFGWNLPFLAQTLCPLLKEIMEEASIVETCGELMRSKLRISSLGPDLYFHSAFPTTESDAVFFGPDTYRFARFIRHALEISQQLSAQINQHIKNPIRILDIGCGTGAGGIVAVRALPYGRSFELTMNDINPAALELTLVNARVAKIPAKTLFGSIFDTIEGKFDLIISNPPYMSDVSSRTYRDGGTQLGLELSIRIFKLAFEHLAPGGKLLLYTGVAMSQQPDPFLSTVAPLLMDANCTWSYEEIDPDIFSEELEMEAYAGTHRIAAVGLIVTRH